jgi:hypothetical protein
MKKWFLSTLVVLSLAGCNETDDLISIDTLGTTSPKRSQLRSYEEAKLIAQQSISMLDSDSDNSVTTRGVSSSRTIQDKDTYIVCADPSETRSSESFDNDTLMYVFNFENKQGFAIVSASNNTEGLLAITEKGYFDPDSISEIEGFNIFIESAKNYVSKAKAQPQNNPQRALHKPLVRDSIGYRPGYAVGPYVSVSWGQIFPEGELCPNGVCGCTNTSIAQIMSYYEYPSSIALTNPTTGPMNQVLNWTLMKSHQTLHTINNCSTPSTHMSISRLSRELGHLNGSTYNPGVYYNATTGTDRFVVPTTMSTLGYQTGSWTDYDFSLVKAQIDSTHLCMMSGLDTSLGRHAWTLDGYHTTEKVVYHLEQLGLNLTWVITGYDLICYIYYCHYNWGWYGNYNGYFSTSAFNSGGGGNYNTEVQFLPIYLQ